MPSAQRNGEGETSASSHAPGSQLLASLRDEAVVIPKPPTDREEPTLRDEGLGQPKGSGRWIVNEREPDGEM